MKLLHRLFFLLLPLLACGATSCSDTEGPEPPLPKKAERTVLVYMIASNSLGNPALAEQYDLRDIQEMRQAAAQGFPKDTRLLVYHVNLDGGEPRLFEITGGHESDDKVLVRYNDASVSSASASRLAQVIKDMKGFASARRYGIVLWSHASGWLQNGLEEDAAAPASFGYDFKRTNAMNVTTLARVLQSQGFDWIYFDCCYMAGVEVAYELRHAASKMVASCAELPADGTPYDKALPPLLQPESDLAGAARAMFETYDQGPQRLRSCTISVIDMEAMDRLASETKALYSLHPSLGCPLTDIQPYQNPGKALYHDFADYVGHLTLPEGAAKAPWLQALEAAVTYAAATPSVSLQNTFAVRTHCGLSTYVITPERKASAYHYDTLSWYRDVAALL